MNVFTHTCAHFGYEAEISLSGLSGFFRFFQTVTQTDIVLHTQPGQHLISQPRNLIYFKVGLHKYTTLLIVDSVVVTGKIKKYIYFKGSENI